MQMNPAQFERHLQSDSPAPVYLIAGAEDLLRIEAADALRARARAVGFAEREVFDVEGSFDWNVVRASLSAMSLFAARRVIELRLPTCKPGKDGGQLIEGFCANPPSDLLLLIVGGEWSRRHEGAWTRAVERCGVLLPLWPLKPNELGGWISRRLRSRGVSASADALALLAARVEGNLLAAAQEIDKLALLAGGETLDAERLAALVADSARFDVFGMAEAAIAGDAARALRMLAGLRGEGEQVAGLLPWLATQLHALARVADVAERGGNTAQAMSQSGIWDARQPAFRRALARVSVGRAERLAAECGRVEQIAKGRAAGDAWLALERLLVALADPRAGDRLLSS
jgi:DNA polymerase-3 subunit delta